MVAEYKMVPYQSMGSYSFGMSRKAVMALMGEPVSALTYGYPISDRFLDDYGFLYFLSSREGFLEAIELYPQYTEDTLVLIYGERIVQISTDIQQTMSELRKISDDFVWEEDTYSSRQLGVKVFCPDDHIENILIYDNQYFEDEME